MSRKTSFEEALQQKLTDLPVPDENASWQKMNALLDEKEKRRTFLFFRYEKIASGVILLCGLMLCIALFLQTGTDSLTKEATADKSSADTVAVLPYHPANPKSSSEKASESGKKKRAPYNTISSFSATSSAASSSLQNKHSIAKKNVGGRASFIALSYSSNNKILFTKKNNTGNKNQDDKVQKEVFANEVERNVANDERTKQNDGYNLPARTDNNELNAPNGTIRKETLPPANNSASAPVIVNTGDTSSSINTQQNLAGTKTGFTKTDSVSSNNTTAKKSIRMRQHNAYFISGGIGIKQQLPLGNQTLTAYNYNGNRSWAGDYIPSIYIKIEKEKRWFVQGEFHYAAPRLVNNTAYRQITKADYGHSSTTQDKYYLQKTWYNEVPLSFNLYLRSSWSVGAGAMYNILRGASAKKETLLYDVTSGHTVYDEDILPWKGYTDSFLYKTNTSLLLQTDYHVKRWSFGLRYLQDVQPCLTYILPDGIKKDKRIASLEVLIRYELLRSGKFRIGK